MILPRNADQRPSIWGFYWGPVKREALQTETPGSRGGLAVSISHIVFASRVGTGGHSYRLGKGGAPPEVPVSRCCWAFPRTAASGLRTAALLQPFE